MLGPGNLQSSSLVLVERHLLKKEEVISTLGIRFFTKMVKGGNKGTKRQLAAQIAMLYLNKMDTNNPTKDFCDIKSQSIDSFYHRNIDFDLEGESAKKIVKILSKFENIYKARPNLAGHEAIHSVLLIDSLLENYTSKWEEAFPRALAEFRNRCKDADKAAKKNKESKYSDYWKLYSRWTRTSSSEKSTIQGRHEFFVNEMLALLEPALTKLDNKRMFSDLEREVIYYRDNNRCQACRMKDTQHTVFWNDAEIHHVLPYSKGGPTELKNGALVHKDCHPESNDDVNEFKRWWMQKDALEEDLRDQPETRKISDLPPDGTMCRFTYGEDVHEGVIENRKLLISGVGAFKTFSAASRAITNTSRNGWSDWFIQLLGQSSWIVADDWRKNRE